MAHIVTARYLTLSDVYCDESKGTTAFKLRAVEHIAQGAASYQHSCFVLTTEQAVAHHGLQVTVRVGLQACSRHVRC